ALPGQRGTAVVAPLEWLFNKSAGTWASASARDDEWRGLALSCNRRHDASLRVADSDTNRADFGLAVGGARGASGYPLVRLAALMAVRSHVLARAAFGPCAGERTRALSRALGRTFSTAR